MGTAGIKRVTPPAMAGGVHIRAYVRAYAASPRTIWLMGLRSPLRPRACTRNQ